MKRATIRDVAREADVSVASVSRALNGLTIVTPETRDRILRAADQLGYVPHAGARSLSLSRTNVIGVVLPDLHGEFFSELIRSLERATAESGYQMLFSTMHSDPELARRAMSAMHGRVDGVVIMAPQLAADWITTIIPQNTPSVLINSPDVIGHDYVRVDNFTGIEVLVRHLLDAGAQRILYIGGPRGNLDADERLAAFRMTLAYDAPNASSLIVPGNFYEESGFDGVTTALAAGERFDAVLGANDGMALGALHALKEAGQVVPEDVMVAGFDDVPLARHLGLTTVRVPLEEIGDRAVGRLIERVEAEKGEPLQCRIIPQLVVRTSTRRFLDV